MSFLLSILWGYCMASSFTRTCIFIKSQLLWLAWYMFYVLREGLCVVKFLPTVFFVHFVFLFCLILYQPSWLLSSFYYMRARCLISHFFFLLLLYFRSAEDANVFLVNDFQSTLQVCAVQYSSEVCLVFATGSW